MQLKGMFKAIDYVFYNEEEMPSRDRTRKEQNMSRQCKEKKKLCQNWGQLQQGIIILSKHVEPSLNALFLVMISWVEHSMYHHVRSVRERELPLFRKVTNSQWQESAILIYTHCIYWILQNDPVSIRIPFIS